MCIDSLRLSSFFGCLYNSESWIYGNSSRQTSSAEPESHSADESEGSRNVDEINPASSDEMGDEPREKRRKVGRDGH